MRRFSEWLIGRWQPTACTPEDVRITFSSGPGARVWQHLMDNVYCARLETTNPNEALAFMARRSVVQELLELYDMAAQPHKYKQPEVEG